MLIIVISSASELVLALLKYFFVLSAPWGHEVEHQDPLALRSSQKPNSCTTPQTMTVIRRGREVAGFGVVNNILSAFSLLLRPLGSHDHTARIISDQLPLNQREAMTIQDVDAPSLSGIWPN